MATTSLKKQVQTRRSVNAPAVSRTSINDPAEVIESTTGDKINLEAESKKPSPVDLEEKVTVIIPKAFTLTRDDGTPVPYAAGTDEMPVSDAAHWFSRAQGVKVYAPKK